MKKQERACCASETAEQREERLRKWTVRDGVRRTAQMAEQRELGLHTDEGERVQATVYSSSSRQRARLSSETCTTASPTVP